MDIKPLPALIYCDIACELYPELADRIKHEVTIFYTDQAERCGEHLIKTGILTTDQHRLVLLRQKAQKDKLEQSDIDELHAIQTAVHMRTMASIETLGIVAQKLRNKLV